MSDDDTAFVQSALARAALLLPDPQDLPGRVRRRRSARLRRRRAATAVAAVAVLAAAGTGLGLSLADRGGTASIQTVTVGDPAQVSDAGARQLGATGLVVAVPGHPVRFCDPEAPTADTGHLPGYTPAPPTDDCAGVDAVGVDLDTLADRAVQSGVVSGHAELRGTLAAGVLHVRSQGRPSVEAPTQQTFDHPPCATPTGGWAVQPGPAGSSNPDVGVAQAYRAAHPTQVQQVAVLRPSAHQALVYVLTNGDPSQARASLATAYRPDQLCVARSDYTPAQIAAAGADPQLTARSGSGVQSDGFELDQTTGQPVDDVSVVVTTTAMTDAGTRYPQGLIRIDAWLVPVAPTYPTNSRGETYGSAAAADTAAQLPDLISVGLSDGRIGYITKADFAEPSLTLAEVRALPTNSAGDFVTPSRTVPVYAEDGRTRIGTFVITSGGSATPR